MDILSLDTETTSVSLFYNPPTSRRSPPFFQERLARRKILKQCVAQFYQRLHSTIHLKTKISMTHDSLRIQGPSNISSSDLLHPVSPVKEHYLKGEKCKMGFTVACFLVPKPHQKLRLVVDLGRLNTFLLEERFKFKYQSP